MALGAESLDAVAARIGAAARGRGPRDSLFDKLRTLPLLAEMARWLPRKRCAARGACQEVVATGAAASLAALPVLRCWPCDGGGS